MVMVRVSGCMNCWAAVVWHESKYKEERHSTRGVQLQMHINLAVQSHWCICMLVMHLTNCVLLGNAPILNVNLHYLSLFFLSFFFFLSAVSSSPICSVLASFFVSSFHPSFITFLSFLPFPFKLPALPALLSNFLISCKPLVPPSVFLMFVCCQLVCPRGSISVWLWQRLKLNEWPILVNSSAHCVPESAAFCLSVYECTRVVSGVDCVFMSYLSSFIHFLYHF